MEITERWLYEAAIIGLDVRHNQIIQQKAEVLERLIEMNRPQAAQPGRPRKVAGAPRKTNAVSAEGRARIAAAQVKRWTEFRKEKG